MRCHVRGRGGAPCSQEYKALLKPEMLGGIGVKRPTLWWARRGGGGPRGSVGVAALACCALSFSKISAEADLEIRSMSMWHEMRTQLPSRKCVRNIGLYMYTQPVELRGRGLQRPAACQKSGGSFFAKKGPNRQLSTHPHSPILVRTHLVEHTVERIWIPSVGPQIGPFVLIGTCLSRWPAGRSRALG